MYKNYPKKQIDKNNLPDYVDGICYNTLQKDLAFGSDSNKDNKTRPVISMRARDSFLIVLPTTTNKNSDFFYLSKDDCLLKSPDTKNKDSYISYFFETLNEGAIKRSKKRGILEHSLRIKIADWLKDKLC